MAKAVLLSIRPEWVEKIVNGRKTVEIRKSHPRIPTLFKCFIYCAKDPRKKFWTGPRYSYIDDHSHNAFDICGSGKVIGEFVCSRINPIQKRGVNDNFDYCYLSINEWGNDDIETEIRDIKASLIPKDNLNAYGEKSHKLYAWHISKLQIYDKPRELGELTGLRQNRFGWEPVEIKRPPQSWCYVEELSNA